MVTVFIHTVLRHSEGNSESMAVDPDPHQKPPSVRIPTWNEKRSRPALLTSRIPFN